MTTRLLLGKSARIAMADARATLRAEGATEVVAARGLTVTAQVLPLFRSARGLEQVVRVTVISEHGARLTIRLRDGADVVDSTEVTPRQAVDLFVPEVAQPTEFRIEVADASGEVASGTVLVTPQRKWTVFVVHHNHLDIGYTDRQGVVLRNHSEYLDSVLDLAESTADWPEAARFRWVVESALAVRQFLGTRPQSTVGRFVTLARKGTIELAAMPFQMHIEACSIEELHRQLRYTDRLREQYGIPVTSAMHTDVPGAPVGLVDALAATGVRYLSAAHNWAGRSVPHLVGGQELERPFWWRSPAGNRVLVWHTDSPHGNAYMEGNGVGLGQSYESTLDLLPGYLHALATKPYPYGPEAFGWHGMMGAEVTKRPYQHDVLHLRVQGGQSDNAGPSIVPASIVKQWNETWAYPRLRASTNTEFFVAAEERLGGDLPEHTGDWTDWWADGLGSGARPLGYARRAQHAVRHAETLHTLAGLHGSDRHADEAVGAIYDKLGLFEEHTWGSTNPWNDHEHGRDSGALQWNRKCEMAYSAEDEAENLRQSGLLRLGDRFGKPENAAASYLVLNAGPGRTDVVQAFLPHTVVPSDTPIAVVDARNGEPVPHDEEVVRQAERPDEPPGRQLTFVAPDMPGAGYVRFDVRPGQTSAAITQLDGTTIENEYYRVDYDLRTGVIASIFDKTAGRELVNTAAEAGMNQYIYDRYGTSGASDQLSGRVTATEQVGSQKPDLLAGRSLGERPWLVRAVRTPIGETLEVALTGEGADELRTTIRLYDGVRRVEIINRVFKRGTDAKESVFFAFPFAVGTAPSAWELTGGVGGPDQPTVPGAVQHFTPIRHWVAFDDGELAVAWSSLQAPLVMLGDLYLPYAPFPPTICPEPAEPGTVYSWAMNNLWDTNFPSRQHGETTFSYAIGSAAGADPRLLGAEVTSGLTDPFLAVPVTGSAPRAPGAPEQHDVVSVGDPRVQVSSLGRSSHGHDLVVYLRSVVGETVETDVRVPYRIRSAYVGTSLERDLRPVDVTDGTRMLQVRVPAGDLVALALDLADDSADLARRGGSTQTVAM